ncbi:MAG: ABC transporter permease [Kiritimatiellae bacterium]|nr:ABC transporter permease [Kiritimatiellia bacterium]
MLSDFLVAAIVAGTPLLFAVLGEIFAERSGKLNLGLEGMMLMGAVVGFQVGLSTSQVGLALLSAMIAGGAGALIFAVLTITLRSNQVVTGLALTMFGMGFSSFVGKNLVGEALPETIKLFFQPYPIPFLCNIPFLGPILFARDPLVYGGYAAVIIGSLYLYRTRCGLHLRAVGENTAAADAAGIRVTLYQYVHVVLGGILCGLGGAYLSLVDVPAWQDNITAGRGWIAIALVIFCKWNPWVVFLGAYLFGGLDIIGFRLQRFDIPISQYIIDMLPYLVTILILVISSVRKSRGSAGPAEMGHPYFREEK